MKLALCFYGQPRFLEKGYCITWKKIIDQFNPDIYIHTWWDADMIGQPYASSPWSQPNISPEDLAVKPDTVEKILTLYNPVDYLIESPINHYLYGKPNNYYQFYTQYKVKELVTAKYDTIIRARLDMKILQEIPIIKTDKLLIPDTCPNPELLTDTLSISNQINFNKISDIYLNLNKFIEQGVGEREYAFKAQIDKENIPYEKFNATYATFDVMRS